MSSKCPGWGRRALPFTALTVCLLSAGCNRQRQTAPTQEEAGRTADATAHFLAGLPGPAKGPFHELETTEAWRSYSAEFARTWDEADREQLRPVDAFQKRELAPLHTGSDFIFYPFSGPDVIYALRFFPEGHTFVFAGLERVGHLREPASYKAARLDRDLRGWRRAVSSIFARSFFVTSEMDREFHGDVADGLLPLIVLLLARNGCTIQRIEYRTLQPSGELTKEEGSPRLHQAVEIRFRRGSDPAVRKLFYFSTNLAAEFERNPAFANFLERQGHPDTLVKSASFLLHWKMCAAMRKYVMENSNLILQDDTGVPFHYLQAPQWQVSLYGRYSPPDRPFRKLYQADLAEAFQDPARVRELGFSLGYGHGKRPSSMILARRVTTR